MSVNKIWENIAPGVIEEGYKVLTGRGDWSIVFHGERADTGFLDNYLLLFPVFEIEQVFGLSYRNQLKGILWLVSIKFIFRAIKETKQKSVLASERAAYQTFLDEQDRRPTTSWGKSKLLTRSQVGKEYLMIGHWPGGFKKIRIKVCIMHAKCIHPRRTRFKKANTFLEWMVEIHILFLPVAHPELNPIEMLWYKVKRQVDSRNMKFLLSTI